MNTYKFDDIIIGMKETFTVIITKEMLESFCKITGDINPLHTNKSFAKEQGYKDCVAYGMLTASFLSTLAGVYLPGKYSLIYEVENKFINPVFIGDTLTISGEVIEKNDIFSFFIMKVVISNQNNKKVLRGKMKVGVL